MAKLSKVKWSKGVTEDGWHVRAGQVLVSATQFPIGGYEVEGVDGKGRACIRGYGGVMVPLRLKAWRTVEG